MFGDALAIQPFTSPRWTQLFAQYAADNNGARPTDVFMDLFPYMTHDEYVGFYAGNIEGPPPQPTLHVQSQSPQEIGDVLPFTPMQVTPDDAVVEESPDDMTDTAPVSGHTIDLAGVTDASGTLWSVIGVGLGIFMAIQKPKAYARTGKRNTRRRSRRRR